MINIRTAQARDAFYLPEIEISSGKIFRKWPGLEWIAEDHVQSADQHLELIEKGISLVAEVQGLHFVGFLNGEIIGEAMHIWQVAVRETNQGQGIGRRLMGAAQHLAKQHLLGHITLTTFREVPWNELFYQKLGFRILDNDAQDLRLRGILDRETQAGLPAELRCAMIKNLR